MMDCITDLIETASEASDYVDTHARFMHSSRDPPSPLAPTACCARPFVYYAYGPNHAVPKTKKAPGSHGHCKPATARKNAGAIGPHNKRHVCIHIHTMTIIRIRGLLLFRVAMKYSKLLGVVNTQGWG